MDELNIREEPPRLRTIIVRGVPRRLMFPWTVSVVVSEKAQFKNLYVYSRPTPMLSVDDTLYRFPLCHESNDSREMAGSHVYHDGRVCMGNTLSQGGDPLSAFWNSGFHECLPNTGILMWERLSAVAPEEVVSLPMCPVDVMSAFFRAYPGASIKTSPWDTNARMEMRREEGRRIARLAWGGAS